MAHRSLFTLLTLFALGACAHAEVPSDETRVPELARGNTHDTPAPSGVLDDASPKAASQDANVISFEDDSDAGPTTTVTAPPNRKHIPSFELFGTDRSDPNTPKMTLPEGVES